MASAKTVQVAEQSWVALLLAVTGGFVDAVGYLVLFKMFTAHMSGNTVAMGIHMAQKDWGDALHRGFAIPVFVIGVAFGSTIQEILARSGRRSTYAATFFLETILLGVFMALGQEVLGASNIAQVPAWRYYALAALPALAMGLQNATLHRIELGTIRTTYISAILTNFTQEMVRALFWLWDKWRRERPRDERFSIGHILVVAGIWFCYVGGAMAGTVLRFQWELYCLAVPIGILCFAMLCDLVRPLKTAER